MKIIFCFISMAMLMSAYGQKIAKDNIYYKAVEAAKKAQADDTSGLKELYQLSLRNHGDLVLSKLMIKAVTLAMLNSGSKNLNSYFSNIEATFSGKKSFSFLDNKPFQVDCERCEGHGKNPCHTCDAGTCRNCKGKKSYTVQKAGNSTETKPCAACNKTGVCLTCKGSGLSTKMCRTCNGKGTVFSREAIPEEYGKSLKDIVDTIPEHAAWKGIYITEGIEQVVKRKKMALAKKKKAEEEALKNMPERTEADLKHPLLEFNEYFRNRERISKQKLYKSASAKMVGAKPTLSVEIEPSIMRADTSLKLQYLEAFYQFWKLRCKFNSLGEDVGFNATYKGKKIAEFKGKKIISL
ncbi:MAG: hypothetical protein NE327_18730 [Lentisphaeraceae bacterium]|nr:hypothetical protein [Lentisphaeraceae bacterium]